MEIKQRYRKIAYLFTRIQYSLDKNNISFIPKLKQIICFDHLLNGNDVLAVLPTGFGKSVLFHFLPDIIPTKVSNNIVIVFCLLNSIIQDQLNFLEKKGINASVLQLEKENDSCDSLFEDKKKNDLTFIVPENIAKGRINLLFSHPESLLNEQGRKLLLSQVFQENVVGCVVDKAHCIDMW